MNRVVSIAGAWDAPEVVSQRAAAKKRADAMLGLGVIGLLALVALMGVLYLYDHHLFGLPEGTTQ